MFLFQGSGVQIHLNCTTISNMVTFNFGFVFTYDGTSSSVQKQQKKIAVSLVDNNNHHYQF